MKLHRVDGTATTRVRAQVSYDAANKEAIITPNAPPEEGATYKAVVTTAVRDLACNLLDQIWTPFKSKSVAHACLRSWERMLGRTPSAP